jgi:DNA-directed RNA polymerase specialized sigma24 family protein
MRRRLELEDSVDLPFERADGSSIDLPSPEVSDRLCELEAQVRALAHLDPLGATALVGREVYGFTYAELAAMTGASPRQVADAAKALARRISR